METKDFSFIILEALVSETGTFQLIRGYERTTAPSSFKSDEKSGDLVISMIGANGEVFVEMAPEVRFPKGCTTADPRPGTALILTAMPLNMKAKLIRINYHGNTVFEGDISDVKPKLPEIAVSIKDGIASVSIGEELPQDEFWVGALLRDGRLLRPNIEFNNNAFHIDLMQLSGLEDAKLVVERSQNFRTSQYTSEYIPLPASETLGMIMEPMEGSEWSFGHKGSLIATLFDNNGRHMEWRENEMEWRFNSEKLDVNKQLTPWSADIAGQHTIQLVHKGQGVDAKILNEAEITVLPPRPDQLLYFKLLKELRPNIELPNLD